MLEAASIPSRTLVLSAVTDSGELHAGVAYELAEAHGMTDQQVRLCLRRLVADGTLVHAGGRGRKGRFHVGELGMAAILPELDLATFAFAQDAGAHRWDGRWHLLSVTLPESRRAQRDRLRSRLTLLGGAPLGSGLFVSANDWRPLIAAAAQEIGVERDITTAVAEELRVGGEDAPKRLATMLWPLDEIAARYRALRAELGDTPGRAHVPAALGVTLALARCMEPDPLLPAELLPDDWPGPATRADVRDRVDLLLTAGEKAGEAVPPGLRRVLRASRP